MNHFGQPRPARRLTLLTLASLILLLVSGSVHAATFSQADQVKVAMLFNILKFVTWPDTNTANEATAIIVGVVGTSELNNLLPMLDNQQIGQRSIKILRLIPGQTLPEPLDVICLGGENTIIKQRVLAYSSSHAVLTVSDRADFVDSGGMIGLIVDGERVKFDINLDAAAAGHISISSKLAALARLVIENGKTRTFR